MRARILLLVLWSGLALALLAGGQTTLPERLWSKADLVDVAAAHAGRLDPKQALFVRYLDLAAIPRARRPLRLRALSLAVNSLSRNDQIVLVQEVPGTEQALCWIDLSQYQIDPRVFDRIGLLGSGKTPTPEPYYHLVETIPPTTRKEWREWGYWIDYRGQTCSESTSGARWVRTREGYIDVAVPGSTRIVASPALGTATILGLEKVTGSRFSIYDHRWLVANALVEPRYHEILGLDDTEASALKLAGADERGADEDGSQIRGAVLFSEVAEENRFLERTPTRARKGRGSLWKSFDFKNSITARDVLKDTLNNQSDAHELIWTLPNGLQGYFVSDARGKRLDKADADIAQNRRRRFKDVQERTGYQCMDCHLAESGHIDVDDEVRALSAKEITLLVNDEFRRDRNRAKRIRQKYLDENINDILKLDRLVVEASARAATGISCKEANDELMGTIADYLQRPVAAVQLARELGVAPAQLNRAIEGSPGLDHTFPGLRVGRLQRRSQIEQAFVQIAVVLASPEPVKVINKDKDVILYSGPATPIVVPVPVPPAAPTVPPGSPPKMEPVKEKPEGRDALTTALQISCAKCHQENLATKGGYTLLTKEGKIHPEADLDLAWKRASAGEMPPPGKATPLTPAILQLLKKEAAKKEMKK